jgi:nucleoside-diphosphate-sugar epimerase
MTTHLSTPHLIIGCGYLGQRVAALWTQAGHTVHALTRSTTRADEFRRQGWQPVLGDLTQPQSLPTFTNVDTLLLAVGLDRRAGHTQREVYVDGLAHLIAACPTPPRRIVSVSSTSVYGQDGGEWIDEDSATEPHAENGQVCLAAERLLQDRWPHAQIVRSAGIYGPGRLIARVEQLRAGTPLSGRPDAWLNLVHVDDLATSVLAVAERAAVGSTWLAVDNRPVTRREFYLALTRLVGAPEPRFTEGDSPASGGLNKRCSNRRLREQLGWVPRYPTIEAGLPPLLELSALSGGTAPSVPSTSTGPAAPRSPVVPPQPERP